MRTLVISGTWGKNMQEQPVHGIETGIKPVNNGVKANIFNGGTCERLKAILSLAEEYDCLVWKPVFKNDNDIVYPNNYIGATKLVLA